MNVPLWSKRRIPKPYAVPIWIGDKAWCLDSRSPPSDQGLTKHTALVRWAPETRFNPHTHVGGEEILVLEGVFRDEHGSYPAGTWIRSPHMSNHRPFTGPEGATILVKVGHLDVA